MINFAVFALVVLAAGFEPPSTALTPEAPEAPEAPDVLIRSDGSENGEAPFVNSIWRRAPANLPTDIVRALARDGETCGDWSADFHEAGSPPEGDAPTCAAFLPDGSAFILGHRDSHNLLVYDADTRTLLHEIVLSGSPQDIAVFPDGESAIVGNIAENTISIVDLNAGEETDTIDVGTMPGVVGVTADGTKAIVGNTGDSEIAIIDLSSGMLLHTITDAPFTMSFTVAPESGSVALDFSRFAVIGSQTIVHPSSGTDEILFIDIASGSVTRVPCTNWPRGIAVSEDETIAIVTHYIEPTISLIDVATSTISSTINIGSNCQGAVALSPGNDKAVIAVQNNCRVVNLDTGTVSGDLSTATVYSMFTTHDGQSVVCSGYRGSIIDLGSESVVANVNNTVSAPVAAISPIEPLAIMAANTFGEDLVISNTDGAAGHLIEVLLSGPAYEGDKCRSVAAHEASDTVLTVNLFSRNAEIINAATGDTLAIAETGRRPSKVAISPDGTRAVIANLDSTFATVIDLLTFAVTEVPISRRGSRVAISPDGAWAYVAVVADGDGVWRIDLDSLEAVGGKLSTGNMGSVGYAYSQPSGMVLSNDGARLVTCDSFDDTITIVDTATWSVEAVVPVGDFPTMASFSANNDTLFVSLRSADAVTIVDLTGSPVVTATVPVGDSPGETAVSADGGMLFVLNTGEQSLGVIDIAAGVMIDEVPMPLPPIGISVRNNCVMIGTGTSSTSAGGSGYSSSQDGTLVLVDAATHAIVAEVPTGVVASQLAVDGDLGAIASPGGDGVVLLQTTPPCPEDVNADGLVGVDDILALIAGWGTSEPDVNGDGVVTTDDLLAVLGAWGPCE